MRAACLFLSVLSCFLFCVPAVADPADCFAGDARTERRIAVESPGIAVNDLLAGIAKTTGVSLRAAAEAADDKLVLFGPPLPLRAVLQDIAVLFGCEWQRVREDPAPTYRLTKNTKTRIREDELARSEVRQLITAMEAQVRALADSSDRLAERAPDDPVRRFLLQPDSRRATQLYAYLSREQREQLFDAGRIRILYADLSPSVQQVVRQIAPPASEPYRTVQVGSRKAQIRQQTLPYDLTFTAHTGDDGKTRLTMSPGDSLFAEIETRTPQIPTHGDPYTGGAIPDRASLPTEGDVRKAVAGDWPERLRLLSEASRRPVLSDYFRLRSRSPMSPDDGSRSGAGGALDAMSRDEGSLWWVRGRSLFFRKTDWYQRRLYEPPDRRLAEAARRLADHHEWPIYADVYRLNDLTFKQQLGLAILGANRNGPIPRIMAHESVSLAGLPLLPALFENAPTYVHRANAPLISRALESTEVYHRAIDAATLRSSGMAEKQHADLLAFLAAQSKQPEGIPIEAFFAYVQADKPVEADRGYRSVPVSIHWQYGPGGLQGDYEIPLPLTIPDDRRGETRISLAP